MTVCINTHVVEYLHSQKCSGLDDKLCGDPRLIGHSEDFDFEGHEKPWRAWSQEGHTESALWGLISYIRFYQDCLVFCVENRRLGWGASGKGESPGAS